MAGEGNPLLYGLLLSNIMVYTLLLLGLLRARRPIVPRVGTITEAFRVLEYWVRRAYPDLPEGFTWREAASRVTKPKGGLDPQRLLSIIERYEAYRYGGRPLEGLDTGEVLRWAEALARGVRGARRPPA